MNDNMSVQVIRNIWKYINETPDMPDSKRFLLEWIAKNAGIRHTYNQIPITSNKQLHQISMVKAMVKFQEVFDYERADTNLALFCDDVINLFWALFREIQSTRKHKQERDCRSGTRPDGEFIVNECGGVNWDELSDKKKHKQEVECEGYWKTPKGKRMRSAYVLKNETYELIQYQKAHSKKLVKSINDRVLDWYNLNKHNITTMTYDDNRLGFNMYSDKDMGGNTNRHMCMNFNELGQFLCDISYRDVGVYVHVETNCVPNKYTFCGNKKMILDRCKENRTFSKYGKIRAAFPIENGVLICWMDDRMMSQTLIPKRYKKYTPLIQQKLSNDGMELSRWNSLKYFEITRDNTKNINIVTKNANNYITNISSSPYNDMWDTQTYPAHTVLYSHTGNTKIADTLIQLANMFEQGLITLTEYQAAKRDLI